MNQLFRQTNFYKSASSKKRYKKNWLLIRFIKISIYIFLLSIVFYSVKNLYFTLQKKTFKIEPVSLSITNFEISGNRVVSKEEVIQMIKEDINNCTVTTCSAEKVRSKLLENLKIRDANVKIELPNKLIIKIKEKKIAAIWWKNDELFTIDIDGNIIENIKEIDFHNKDEILFFGENQKAPMKEILYIIEKNKMKHLINSISFLSNRRWDIFLKTGIMVKLPEENLEDAMKFLKNLLGKNFSSKTVSEIDLRLFPDKMYLKYKKTTSEEIQKNDQAKKKYSRSF